MPEADFKRIFGDFRGTDRLVRNVIDKPLNFWRGLVLTYRPAWVVNNFVGQTLIYAVNNANPGGVTAYARAVLDTLRESGSGKGFPVARLAQTKKKKQRRGVPTVTQLHSTGKRAKRTYDAQMRGLAEEAGITYKASRLKKPSEIRERAEQVRPRDEDGNPLPGTQADASLVHDIVSGPHRHRDARTDRRAHRGTQRARHRSRRQ